MLKKITIVKNGKLPIARSIAACVFYLVLLEYSFVVCFVFYLHNWYEMSARATMYLHQHFSLRREGGSAAFVQDLW